MAIADDAESYLQEFHAEFARWQVRVDTLREMARITALSPERIDRGARRIESILQAARDQLAQVQTMPAEEWMAVRPRVTAAMRDIQSCYNRLAADWYSL